MRCVCKPWKALLYESSLIKSHLHRSIQNNDKILLFFRMESYCTSFTVCPSRSPNLKLTNFIKLLVTFQPKYRIIGSVNGLICFYYGSYDGDYVVGIWNPSLSALLTLPPISLPALEPGVSSIFGFGFGFDSKADDYKVVKIATVFQPARNIWQLEVYSMREGSWKTISERFPWHTTMFIYGNQVCVDDNLHWLGAAIEWKPKTIVAFDLGAETICEIPFPDSILHHQGYLFNVLGVLGGKLCVMQSRVRDGNCEVWVIDKYGVAESWVKHHAFSRFSGDIFPYGFTSRNEFLFRVGDHFPLYDPVAAKTKIFKVMSGNFTIGKIVEYVDSLVWIEPANQLQI